MYSCIWLMLVNLIFLSFIQVFIQFSRVFFFFLLSNTPLYECTSVCLLSVPLMDIWVVSSFGAIRKTAAINILKQIFFMDIWLLSFLLNKWIFIKHWRSFLIIIPCRETIIYFRQGKRKMPIFLLGQERFIDTILLNPNSLSNSFILSICTHPCFLTILNKPFSLPLN